MANEIDTSAEMNSFNTESLSTLCLDVIARNLTKTIARDISKQGLLELRDNIAFLPAEICDDVLSTYVHEGLVLNDKIIHMFRDRSRSRVTSVNLSNSLITDWSLQWLSRHAITRIDISGCNELSLSCQAVQKIIKNMARNLEVLNLGDKANLLFKRSSRDSTAGGGGDEVPPMEQLPVQDELGDGISRSLVQMTFLDAPKLKKLSLHDVTGPDTDFRISNFLMPLTSIQHLDLSGCQLRLDRLPILMSLQQLSTLVLHNVLPASFDLNTYLPVLTTLKSLQHLDLSIIRNYRHPVKQYPSVSSQDKALQDLLSALPSLYSLDISGTHLAGEEIEKKPSTKKELPPSDPIKIAIPGLAGRHFDFLGLLNCVGDPCTRNTIPADRVTGDLDLAQVLESLRVYQRRSSYCNDALTNLYHILKDDWTGASNYSEILRLICEVMTRHRKSLDRQISGSAAMFYLIKTGDPNRPSLHSYASTRLIRRAVTNLYDAMDTHFHDKAMLRNGLLTFCHFLLPEDGLFMYKDLVSLLLRIIRQSDLRQDEFLQRISLYLMNNLVRSVENHEKLLVGDQGAVKTMLWLIKSKLEFAEPDEILEMAWSTLWNITDETEENCQRFLIGEGEEAGLTLFIECYKKFYNTGNDTNVAIREALLRNMMGLLGNVSEVRELRSKFLQPTYLNLFRALLESNSDGIEVSYHAAGILCHILSDGHELSAWKLCDAAIQTEDGEIAGSTQSTNPSDFDMIDSWFSDEGGADEGGADGGGTDEGGAGWGGACMDAMAQGGFRISDTSYFERVTSSSKQNVLGSLVVAINRWDINSQRSINYRSFKPILALLECEHTVEVRHWAIWALCNLTTVYPDKYCTLLRDEGGIEILRRLLTDPANQSQDVISLASTTLKNCQAVFHGLQIQIPSDSLQDQFSSTSSA